MTLAALRRRVEKLEAGRRAPPPGSAFRDPTTGEMVPLAELLDHLTIGEILLAEALLDARLLQHHVAVRHRDAGPDAPVDHSANEEDRRKFAESHACDVAREAIEAMLTASPEQIETWFEQVLALAFARRRADPRRQSRDHRDGRDCFPWPIPAPEQVSCAVVV